MKRISNEGSDFFRKMFAVLYIIFAIALIVISYQAGFYFMIIFFVIGLFVGISISYFTFWRIFDQVFVDYQNHFFVAKNSNSSKRIEKPMKDLKEVEVSLGFIKLIFSDGSKILFLPPGLGITLGNEAKYIVHELTMIKEINANMINKEKARKV